MEDKLCRLREELVVTKEALNAAQLRQDMTQREKDEVGKSRGCFSNCKHVVDTSRTYVDQRCTLHHCKVLIWC